SCPDGWLDAIGQRHRQLLRSASHFHVTHRPPRSEDPAHATHGLTTDQATHLKEPGIVVLKLLERVVTQHDGVNPIGDLQDEPITAPDRARGGRYDLSFEHRFVESAPLVCRGAMFKGCVGHHDDLGGWILFSKGAYGLIELGKARRYP